MSTPDSIKTQIQNLISTANTTTGKTDTNLTTAIASLISGYGGGGDVIYNGLRYNEGAGYVEMVKGGMIINHNCGFVPDIFILYPKFEVTVGSANEEVAFIGYYGSSLDGISSSMNNACFVLENRTSYTDNFVWQLASSQPNIPDTTTPITEMQIRLPYRSANYIFRTDVEYGWIAIASVADSEDGDFGKSYWLENLKNKTDWSYAFQGWTSERIPDVDTSHVEKMISTFQNSDIAYLHPLDLSSCTTVGSMFRFAWHQNLESIEVKNTGNVQSWSYFVYQSNSIKSIKTLDLSSATSVSNIVASCANVETLLFVEGTIKISINLNKLGVLSDESIQSIIDGLATVETAQTLTLHADVKARVTEEQVSTITSKNWTLA